MFDTHAGCSSLLEPSLSHYHTNLQKHLNTLIYISMMNSEKERPKADVKSEPVELLGSLTTYNGVQRGESPGQTVRTSARVFKKMRQDSSQLLPSTSNAALIQEPTEKDKKEMRLETVEKIEKESGVSSSNISSGIINKQSTNTAKQRMPKALWSTGEKNLFFEALNEYGKDFDSITAYICNKMKKKGVPDNLTKKKQQVSHFYYRTFQKVSKHIKFGDDVKKVVQELYALINYGEMKKRLTSEARAVFRLSELVWQGVISVRTGGRTVRVRTPVCRALRRLNKLEEWEENLKLPSRVAVCLNPRDMEAWSRVHAAAHNPRLLLAAAPSRRIAPVLTLLQRRWLTPTDFIRESLIASDECKNIDAANSLDQQINSVLSHTTTNCTFNKLNMQENCLDVKKDIKNCSSKTDEFSQLHDSNLIKQNVNLSTAQCDVRSSEDISENVGKIGLENKVKIEDSVLSSFESANKDSDSKNKQLKKNEDVCEKICKPQKWQVVEESKDLMLYVGPKPGTDIHIPTINVSEHLTSQRISLSTYQKRLGSGLIYMQTSSNQIGAGVKVGGKLKAKRQRKDSEDNDLTKKQKLDSENYDKSDLNFNVFDIDETANDGMNETLCENKINDGSKDLLLDEKSNDDKDLNDFGDKEFFSEHEYDDKYNETDGECDVVSKPLKSSKSNLKVKTKKERDNAIGNNRDVPANDNVEDAGKPSNTFSTFFKKNWNRDLLIEQIQKGWSLWDAGDLTFGDLYLMFGNESKLELNYWWTKGTLPLPDDIVQQIKLSLEKNDNISEKPIKEGDSTNIPNANSDDKNKKYENDAALQSPKHQDNNIDIDDVKKESHMLSPDSKNHFIEDEPNITSLNLASKIINNPNTAVNQSPQSHPEPKISDNSMIVRQREQVVPLTVRLKKLLSLSQLYMKKKSTSCACGHICSGIRGKKTGSTMNQNDIISLNSGSDAAVCKYPLLRVPYKLPVNTQNLKMPVNRLESTNNQPSPSMVPVQSEDFVSKQNINFVSKPISVISKQNVNDDKRESETATPEVFRAPASLARSKVKNLNTDVLAAQLDFSSLPRWNNRGRKRKQDSPVVARKLIPLAPRPSDIDSQLVLNSVLQQQPNIVTATCKLPLISICRMPPIDELSKSISSITKNTDDNNLSEGNNEGGNFTSNASLFGSTSESEVDWDSDDVSNQKAIIQDGGPCLSNLLDISLPSNIGDDNSLGVGSIKVKGMYIPNKSDTFSDVALMKTETSNISIPSMSPSQLLKLENDENWLSAEQDFSLSSFLGHLEGGPLKTDSDSPPKDSSITPSSHIVDLNISSRGTEETVDTQFQCLISETSIDYMAKFADLAAQVTADNTK